MKILKNLNLTKLEFIEFQLRFILKELRYNDRDFNYLSYIYVYGDKAREQILSDKLSNSRASIDNYFTKFRKDNVITGRADQLAINSEILLTIEPTTYIFQITINEKENETKGETK